jgi:uncharacterized Zn ribbon protein
MNCANCNKTFTCGCQKAFDDQGTTICKTCVNEWAEKKLSGQASSQVLPTRDLNLELAAQQIRDLRNK